MTDDNVINMPTPMTVLADKLRAAYAREKTTRAAWIDAMLEIAKLLAEARDRFRENQEFSLWLISNELDEHGKDDRAALIIIGRESKLARMVMEDVPSESVRLLARKMHERTAWATERAETLRVRNAENTESENEPPLESPQSEPQEAATTESTPAETMKSVDEPTPTERFRRPTKPSAEQNPRLETKSPPPSLKGLPKAEIVAAYLTHGDTPGRLAKFVKAKKGRDIWMLLVESIEAGHFGEPTDRAVTSPNLRLILPWIQDRSFGNMDISKPAERQQIRDVLFPLLVERPELKDSLQAALPSAFRDRQKSIQESARREFLVADARAKAAAAATKEASTVIIAYGTPLWPADPERVGYTLAELECACHFARFFMTAIMRANETPKGMQLAAAHLVKYMIPIQRGFVRAVNLIFDAYVANPKGESEMPIIPKAD